MDQRRSAGAEAFPLSIWRARWSFVPKPFSWAGKGGSIEPNLLSNRFI
jgi:hypothetical protein